MPLSADEWAQLVLNDLYALRGAINEALQDYEYHRERLQALRTAGDMAQFAQYTVQAAAQAEELSRRMAAVGFGMLRSRGGLLVAAYQEGKETQA